MYGIKCKKKVQEAFWDCNSSNADRARRPYQTVCKFRKVGSVIISVISLNLNVLEPTELNHIAI